MKLYKFRPLGSELDFCRAKSILETGKFWCSSFWELNDPMEGVYRFSDDIIKSNLEKVNESKTKYKICSFSGEDAFSNPIMWGYYANGFKGIAIEIEVEAPSDSIYNMKYVNKIEDFPFVNESDSNEPEIVTEILRTKLCKWVHEDEYRFLRISDCNKFEIKKITNVFFGAPYAETNNYDDVKEFSIIKGYNERKKDLLETIKVKGIDVYSVKVELNKVIIDSKILA